MSTIVHIPQPLALARPSSLAVEERRVLGWLLTLALLHGLLYTFLLPPWQHYDEPKHFEYAGQEAAGDAGFDTQVRLSREIADSMYRHRFWPAGLAPDLLGPEPAAIGQSQRLHPPLYYRLAALVVAPLQGGPVEVQLYAARLLSVAFYALTIAAFWRVAVTIVPDEPVAQVALPLLALVSPAFADLMSAVNSDVLVNFAAAAMLLGCALLIRDGPGLAGLALATLGLACALLAKRTAAFAVVPVALALLWAIRRQPLRWWVYLGSTLLISSVIFTVGFQVTMAEGAAGRHLAVAPRAWLDSLDRAYLRLNIAEWLRSASDLQRSGPLYPEVVRVVFTSFWARLAWGHVGLGGLVDLVAALVYVITSLGVVVWLWRSRALLSAWQYRWVVLCVITVLGAWLSTVARLHPLPIDPQTIYLPRGRYMFWAFLPTLWLVALGWQSLVPERWRGRGLYTLLVLFVALDLVALVTLARVYNSSPVG